MKTASKIGIFLLCFAPLFSWAQTLVASADRTRIGVNETLNLQLEYDQQIDSRQLDSSGLQQDFEILNSSTASQVSIINGRQDVSTRWTFVLLPKRAGTAIIPSFQLDGNFSEAISIEVEEASAATARSQPISVELLVSENSVSVMEQLLVTVRLIASPQVSNLSGDSLSIEGAEVTLLDQSQYSEVANGANWQINEWTYAVFADQPTSLEIPGQLFSGVIGSTRSIFDTFGGSGQRTLARSPAARIEVTSAPQGQYWFPASEVQIEEDWPDSGSGSLAEYRVGEPITRTISVIAFGQRPETIPPLPDAQNDQFKVYADQPELITQTSETHLIGVRSESAAIVPTHAGEMTLPEIRIPWWDVEESVWKEAILPAQTINILEAESSAALAPPETFEAAAVTAENLPQASLLNSIWVWSTAVFAFISLALALMLLRRPKPAVMHEQKVENTSSKEQQLWSSLNREFKNGSALTLRKALQNWCQAMWPNESASPLLRLSAKLSDQASAELSLLEQSIYGSQNTELPSFEQLRAELKTLRKKAGNKSDTAEALAPLNPL